MPAAVATVSKPTERVTRSRSGKRGRRPWTLRSAAVAWAGSALRGKVSRKVSRWRAAPTASATRTASSPHPVAAAAKRPRVRASIIVLLRLLGLLFLGLFGFHAGEREGQQRGCEPL